jgi:hypothetical protein
MLLGGWRSRAMLDRYGKAAAADCAADAHRRLSLGDRIGFGSSPENARCGAAFPQDRCDRLLPNQVVSQPSKAGHNSPLGIAS